MKKYFSLLLFLVFWSCQSADSELKKEAGEPAPPVDLITSEYAAVPLARLAHADSISVLPDLEGQRKSTYLVSTFIPHSDDKVLNDLIQTHIGQTIAKEEAGMRVTNLDQVIRTFIRGRTKAYSRMATNEHIEEITFNHVYKYASSVLYNENNTLSLETSAYIDAGGASPGYAFTLQSFRVSPPKQMTLGDVFTDEGIEKLTGLINSQIDQKMLYDRKEDVPPTENFAITFEGFTFRFPPYNIRPHAAMGFEVKVKKEDVLEYLR